MVEILDLLGWLQPLIYILKVMKLIVQQCDLLKSDVVR
jgi:hypothetical protein